MSLRPPNPTHTFGLIALAVALSVTVALPDIAMATVVDAAVSECRKQADASARLRCYDTIVLPEAASADHWRGRNGTDSFGFQASAGMRLLVEHDDAILVGALKDADGNLLQNLHLAGRGRLSVTLPDDGDYTVTLSATGAWTARLSADSD